MPTDREAKMSVKRGEQVFKSIKSKKIAEMNGTKLRRLEQTLVVIDEGDPIVVIVPYAAFTSMRNTFLNIERALSSPECERMVQQIRDISLARKATNA